MAIDINIDNVTNSTSVTNAVSNGTGTFDKLMNSVNLYLNDQYNNGRLKGTDYANVLLGSIQAVLQQAVQFELQEELTEAQVGIAQKDLELKEYDLINLKPQELALMQAEIEAKLREIEIREIEANRARDTTEAELEKQWGYEVTRDADGNLVLGASTGTGKLDKDILATDKQIEMVDQQILTEVQQTRAVDASADKAEFEFGTLLPKQAVLLDEEKETSDLQQLLLATEEELKQYEHDVLQLDQHNTNLKQQALLEEQERSTYTERVLKDKQAAGLGLDTVVKTANVTPEAVYTPKYEEQ
jgi:hypothetical protein